MNSLDVQAWSPNLRTVALVPGRVAPVTNCGIDKPSGGFWTSTWDAYGGGWLNWCVDQSFGTPPFEVYLLTPDPAARVYTIDGPAALRNLAVRYPLTLWPGHEGIDWTSVAAEYDAVRLTEDGHWSTRNPRGDGPSTYSWDCESTCWFRWCFTDVRHHGPWSPPSKPCDHDSGQSDTCWRCSGTGTVWLSRYDLTSASDL